MVLSAPVSSDIETINVDEGSETMTEFSRLILGQENPSHVLTPTGTSAGSCVYYAFPLGSAWTGLPGNGQIFDPDHAISGGYIVGYPATSTRYPMYFISDPIIVPSTKNYTLKELSVAISGSGDLRGRYIYIECVDPVRGIVVLNQRWEASDATDPLTYVVINSSTVRNFPEIYCSSGSHVKVIMDSDKDDGTPNNISIGLVFQSRGAGV